MRENLHKKTHAPHWKEFSHKELVDYFRQLSGDFGVRRQWYMSDRSGMEHLNWKGRLVYDTANIIPAFRTGIYLEVEIERKRAGITITPEW